MKNDSAGTRRVLSALGMTRRCSRTFAVMTLIFGIAGVLSCSSSKSDDMDLVPMSKPGGDAVKPEISATAVIDWQRFFRQPPQPDERKIIAHQLDGWKESGGVEDLLKKGRNELSIGRISEAERTLREAARLDEDNMEVLLQLATVYIRKHDQNRSFEFLQRLHERIVSEDHVDPSVVLRYRYALALGYLMRGTHDKARGILTELIARDNAFTPAYAALAGSYLTSAKTDEAEFIAKRGLDRAKDDASLYNVLGVVADRRGRVEESEEWFRKALSLDASAVPVYVNRANLKIRTGRFPEAEDDLRAALMIAPQEVNSWVALGVCQRRQGRFDDARVSFNKAIDLHPDSASARFNLAVLIAEDFHEPAAALRLFHETVDTEDNDPRTKELASLYIHDLETDEPR